MFRLGRKRVKSPTSVVRGFQLYLRLFARAGILLGLYASQANAQQLPVPCGGGACAPSGVPVGWVTSGQVQPPTVTGSTMHINQQSDKAILNWASFNVDAGAAVNFTQPSNASVALNRIYQGDASQINGAIHANGQIYLINQNGIVFGGGAQIDVHGLVASTLDVDDQLFNSSGIAQAINQSTPDAAFKAKGTMGDIKIMPGAVIKTDDNGQVLIFAPNVTNQGEIDTPQGQTILGASKDKVYLKINSSSDPGLRGFLVEVGTGGTVTNGGKITVGHGNATLMGHIVNQNGIVSATTSVQLNGSIRLLARDQVNESNLQKYSQAPNSPQIATRGGDVTLGPGSVTQVLPDLADSTTAVDSQTQLPSTVKIMGKTIDLQAASKVVAPGGQVTLTATTNPTSPTSGSLVANDSRILMEAQSLIDVSGTTSTDLPMDRNIVQVQLRGNELADSPVQRDGILNGQTVNIDARKGTTLANVSGAVDNIQRTVGERLSVGGAVTASSEGDFILSKDASVNFSGGQVRYESGYLNTTKLYNSDTGQIVDIGSADPNQHYSAVVGVYQRVHAKWGVTETYLTPISNSLATYEPGYVQGMDAGSFNVKAPHMILDGDLHGKQIAGMLQRIPASTLADGQAVWARPYNQVPLGGLLTIGDPGQLSSQGLPDFRAPSITFESQASPAAPIGISDPFPAADQALVLSDDVFSRSGITRAALYSNSGITIPADSKLTMAPGGTLTLVAGSSQTPGDPGGVIAPSLTVDGAIEIPDGQVNLSSVATQAVAASNPKSYQAVTMGSDAKIDTSGLWVNDSVLLNPNGASAPEFIGGGAVSIDTPGNLTLSSGSTIDVSGGAHLQSGGSVTAGTGGDITLASSGNFTSTLRLDGTLKGYSLGAGGTLTIKADGIRIQEPSADYQPKPGELVLAPSFLQSGGFNSYNLEADALGLSIADNTQIHLKAENLVLDPGYQTRVTGADMGQFSHIAVLPEPQRNPVNVSLVSLRKSQHGVDLNAGLTVGTNSLIQTDPLAQVSLRSDRMLTIDGTIDAPAGQISLQLDSSRSAEGFLAGKAIWLLPDARLEAPAYVQLLPNDYGYRVGRVFDAGSVNMSVKDGFIVTQTGSAIDVSGTSQVLDILTDTGSGSDYVPVDVAGAAGSITLQAADGMYLDGTMTARAAPVAGAVGGSLSVTLDSLPRPDEDFTAGNGLLYAPKGSRIIHLTDATTPSLPQGVVPGDALLSQTQLDTLRGTTKSNDVTSTATLSTSSIEKGGFQSVTLKVRPVIGDSGVIRPTSSAKVMFDGNVTLDVARKITLDTPALATQGGEVNLSAPYVAIGPTDTLNRLTAPATNGGGVLNVKADLIDIIGNASLQGFGTDTTPAANLQAVEDIRLQGLRIFGERAITGSFTAAGDMVLRAGQLYPTTLSQYTLAVSGDPQGTIRFEGGGATSAPLSVDGILNIAAPNIDQAGTLRAPFGQIVFNAAKSLKLEAGSVTSVSGAGMTVPFGQTQLGQDWVIPYLALAGEVPPQLSVVSTQQNGAAYSLPLPEKRVTLNAPSVSFDKGATIDVSGGGDMYAYEFAPGPGGSKDILLPQNANGAFAVVPALGSLYAPSDPVISSQGIQAGDTIYLGAANGLPAGEYAVLPARYALLPGAYLITPVAGTLGLDPGRAYNRADGIPVVAGQRRVAGTNIAASLWSGYAVENGSQVRQRAQYTESYASTFFNSSGNASITAPQLPLDAGNVTINAGKDLTLGGRIDGQTDGGRGSQVDIVGQQISVVDQQGGDGAGIQILADGINALGADSVLLGGEREMTANGIVVHATAQTVDIGPGVAIQAPELMLVAASTTDDQGNNVPGQINVANGAVLKGTGPATGSGDSLLLDGDSALLRIASGGEPGIQRSNIPSTPTSQLNVSDGAKLIAGNVADDGTLQGGSLILDSAGDAVSSGEIQIGTGGSVRLGASRISLGDVVNADINQGLVLSNDALAGLNVTNMSLVSASGIDLYGNAALTAGDLTLQAQSFNGYAATGQTAALNGDTVNLIGGSAATAPAPASLAGTLDINAQTINLGSTDPSASGVAEQLPVYGFDKVNLTANSVVINNTGVFKSSGELNITTGKVTSAGAADWRVTSDAALDVLSNPQAPAVAGAAGLGGSLALEGQQVMFNTTADLPSGSLTLAATGGASTDDAVVGANAVIDVSGTTVAFSDKTVASPGGRVGLQSDQGNVLIQGGSAITVAGGNDSAPAGTVALTAPNGSVTINGAVTANNSLGTDTQGNFSLDAADVADFSALTNTLTEGGFTGTDSIRTHSGDLVIAAGDVIKSHNLSLTADSGNIDVFGQIDASGAQGGTVNLNAGQSLTLHDTARIGAAGTGDNTKGGEVDLGTAQGGITFENGAVVDVSGTRKTDLTLQQQGQSVTRTETGTVRFRMPRTSLASSDLTGAADGIIGSGNTVVEGYQVYSNDTGSLSGNAVSSTSTNPYYQDAVTFMQNEQAVMAGLGLPNDSNIQLRPGIEIRSQGSLTLNSPWDLSKWRFGTLGAPGDLTLRVAGDLKLNKEISDGFNENALNPNNPYAPPSDILRQDDSWSMHLISGANLASADPLSVVQGAGDMTVGNNVRVRTGTGSIDIATGGNLILKNTASVVYTAGIDNGTSTYDPIFATYFLGGQYPVGGGDLRINVDGNITAKASTQLINDWLPRLGGPSSFGTLPTTWAVDFGKFKQGVGALGGGNVQVSAGGNISDLSVVMPTIGTQVGQAQYDIGTGKVTTQTNEVVVTGGDSLSVHADGNVLGGTLYAGQGAGVLSASGSIEKSKQNSLYPVLALDGGKFTVEAGADMGIESVINPMMQPQNPAQALSGTLPASYFLTYAPDSAVDLTSLSGNIRFSNNTFLLKKLTAGASDTTLTTYPGTLAATALQGDIDLGQHNFTLAPAPTGQLELLAAGSVTIDDGQTARVKLSDTDISTLPTVDHPTNTLLNVIDTLTATGADTTNHAPTPVHLGDAQPVRIEALNGSIGATAGTGGQLYFYLAKPFNLIAGQDIRNTSVVAQNLAPGDVSLIQAGRDIAFDNTRVPTTGQFGDDSALQFLVDGPGYLDVLAGRNIDLGTSGGIITRGNTQNPVLAENGASLLIAAGMAAKPDYAAFINEYLVNSNDYQAQLDAFLADYPNSDSSLSDIARFQALPLQAQRRFIFDVLFNELKGSGTAAATSKNQDYSRGFNAINTLFPGSIDGADGITGNISLLLSRITTLDGGDITLMVPRGIINAGVANTSVVTKDAGELGIVVQRTGNLEAYVRGDFLVNQSRVFALDGGNILIWSSLGNIDAGRGAKTAIFAPGVTSSYNSKGILTLTIPPAIAGSGIQAAVTTPGTPPGNVYLFAPQGIVNAGDAGISSKGNLTIAAVEVRGSDNINVGGVSVGVPVVNTGGLAAGLTSVSNVTSGVTKTTEDSVNSLASSQTSNTPLADAALSFLEVTVTKLGNEPVGGGN